jgi:glucose-6-phosphate isomerase
MDVGGTVFGSCRLSVYLPAAFAGLRSDRALEGASVGACHRRSLWRKWPQSRLESFLREEWVTMLWSYSDGLRDFGGWWQQLWAESLAKKVNRHGGPAPRVSTPIAAVGRATNIRFCSK